MTFLRTSRPRTGYIRVQTREAPDGHLCDEPATREVWTIPRGLDGAHTVRAKTVSAPEWDYYTIYWVVPSTPGACDNRALRYLGIGAPCALEFIVIRRNNDGHTFSDMRAVDQDKVEGALMQ